MPNLARTLLRIERTVRAVRIATELADEPVPAVAARHQIDSVVGAALRRDVGRGVTTAGSVLATALDASPAALAARGVWVHQDRDTWRPLVYCAVALGVPAAAPFLAERAGIGAMSSDLSSGVVDGAATAGLASLGVMPAAAAGLAALAGTVVRIRRGATPSEALTGVIAGWVWARVAAAVVRPLHDDTPSVEPVEISEYRQRRSGAPGG